MSPKVLCTNSRELNSLYFVFVGQTIPVWPILSLPAWFPMVVRVVSMVVSSRLLFRLAGGD